MEKKRMKKWMKKWMISEKSNENNCDTEKTVFCIARLFFVTSLDPTRDAQRS